MPFQINIMKKLILFLFLIISINAFSQQPVLRQDSTVIHLSSGNELAVIITRKKEETKPLPAIVRYSIYANTAVDQFYNSLAVLRGYVGVTVYVRGKHSSNKDLSPFKNDANDAWDMIDWVSKQSWCDGKVGMYGASYLGFSQWAAVKKLHPALKTIVPQSAVGLGIDFPSHNNIFSGYVLNWIHYVTDHQNIDEKAIKEFSDYKKWNSLYNTWYKSGKSFASLDQLEGRPNAIFQEWLKHPSYDSYWKDKVTSDQDFANLDIPILTIAGYFDADQGGAMHYFKQHYANQPKANHYLVLGPYDHFGLQQLSMPKIVGGYTLDSVAIIKTYALTFSWFDYILKGGTKPSLLEDKVNFQVMGANKWAHVPNLAAVSNAKLTYYLGSSKTGASYSLLTTPVSNGGSIKQQISYMDRTDTIGIGKAPLVLDSTLSIGKNSLIFETAAFKNHVVFSGSITGNIAFIINKKDVDISYALYEKLENGTYLQLNNETMRASFAKDPSKRQLLTPGKVANIPLSANTFFISRQLAKGSKLVFMLSINKEPGVEINYGTGKPVSLETIKDGKKDLLINWLPESYITIPIQDTLVDD